MKKKIWIPLCIVLALILLIGSGLLYMSAKSLDFSVGRVLSASSSMMLVLDNSPIQMSNHTGNENLFAKLTDGDKVLVLHDSIAESYPGKTGVYAIFKLSDGSIADIPGDVLTQLAELGWRTDVKIELPKIMPEDFSFALTWDCYGISSYDSKTGKLVKTTDATHPEDYVTKYTLYEDEAERIYDFIRALNVNEYPEIYNPHGNAASQPPMTLILTVRLGDKEKMIKAENIAISYETNNEKGQNFLNACKAIRDILTSTEEWKSLPEYEFFYD